MLPTLQGWFIEIMTGAKMSLKNILSMMFLLFCLLNVFFVKSIKMLCFAANPRGWGIITEKKDWCIRNINTVSFKILIQQILVIY